VEETSQEDYDWDYEEERRPRRILWGRVFALGLLLLLAFFFGRATGGTSGEIDELRTTLEIRDARIDDLENQLDAAREANAAQPDGGASPAEGGTTGEGDAGPAGEDAEVQEHVVEPGETLVDIAQECYGDPTLDDFIMAANDISDPTLLRVGDTIVCPAAP